MNQPLVLLVDDEETFREIFSVRLRSAGFDVETATNGNEAFEKAKALQPNIILLDVHMPGEDGVATLNKILGDPLTSEAKVFFLTSLGELGPGGVAIDDGVAKQAGAQGYFKKDQSVDTLATSLQNYLAKN